MRSINRPRLHGTLTLAIALMAAAPGCEWLSPAGEMVSEEEQPRTVYALGRVEPATGVIDIRATPGDRLKELLNVVEDEIAPEDGVLGLLSSYDLGKAQLMALLKKKELTIEKHAQQNQLAEAQLAQAFASKAQVEAKRIELSLQLGKLEVLRVARDLAEKEYLRLEQLRSADPALVTQYQLGKQKNRMDLASEDYKIARDSHASAMAAAELAVVAAEANVSVAELAKRQTAKNYEKLVVDQEIEVAREVLKRSILLAPNESPSSMRELLMVEASENFQADRGPDIKPQYTVLKVFLRRGEVVTQSPILQLGDLRKMVCIAEVYEADVKELWVGQTVTIRSPAFSGRFADGVIDPTSKKRSGGIKGHVVRIGRMIVPPGLWNRNPLAPVDRSVVEVRIEIEEEDKTQDSSETAIEHASRHVGLQVTVEFGKRKTESGEPGA